MPSTRRKQAKTYRQIARIPTTGGCEADQVLLALAHKLDHEAEALEKTLSRDGAAAYSTNSPARSSTSA
jgi:hypothetical protein